MRISRLELAGAGDRPEVTLDQLSYGLNVITGRSSVCKSEFAACMAHLLYGRRAIPSQPTSGSIDIDTDLGNFRLRRDSQPGGSCRLTIAGLGEATATAETISKLLRGCSPEFLAGLYYCDGTQAPCLDWLLSETVAANVSRLCRGRGSSFDDRHHQEELLAQRDEFAQQVALLLAERRRTSESIARHLEDLARHRTEVLAGIESAREELHAVDVELAEISAQARYHELETLADETARSTDRPGDALRLDEIDDQIERWRTTLHDLERRESQVRTELARNRPTDSAASLPLADQRAALAVTERLVQDLQNEIARFARSVTSSACVCRDAHPRLRPLVTLLEQQVRRLVTLTEEHEHVVRSQELLSEAQHLSRSQAELRDQLEHLQTQRESLSRRARPRRWRSAEAIEPAALRRPSTESPELERKRHQLASTLEERRQQLHELDQRHERALAERKSILSDRLLEQKQAELAEIQRRLQPSHRVRKPSHHVSESSPHVRHAKRSSDYLAQLTDGRFIELKLSSGGRRAVVVDRHVHTYAVESLPVAEQHLVALSLSLAIIAGLSETGFQLPVILDEPFAQLSDHQTAILAGVLRDFSGQQLFVFTDRHAALEHFRAWGVTIHNLHDSYRPVAVPPLAPRHFPEEKPTRHVQASAEVADATVTLKPSDPIERFPVLESETRKALAPANIRTIADLLIADPTRVAKQILQRQVTPAVVALWQSHAGLLCFVPGLTLDDAQVLTSVGIHSTRELAADGARGLRTRIGEYLASSRGQRFVDRGYHVTQESAQHLIAVAKCAAEQFSSEPSWRTWLKCTTERQELTLVEHPPADPKPALRIKRERPKRKRRGKSTGERNRDQRPKNERPSRKRPPSLKFHLELQSPIGEAPSITPEIAEQLSAAGIRHVRDLLAADTGKLATRLAEREIEAAEIVAWQHQTRLCCRIPNLRASEAAVLVGAGFSTPEDVASMKPAELHGFIQSFSQTNEGRELLADSSPPDLATIEHWIRAARHSRALGAA